ncbi:Nicotinamide riboside kinase 1, partial [Stegodyphus mimosarum]
MTSIIKSIMDTKWILVGISGCTNAGKTTLASFLNEKYPGCVIVNQDHFFRSENSEHHIHIPELNHKNWERLEAVDWEAMMENLSEVTSKNPRNEKSLLIVEGHIIFNHPIVRNLFHKKYFLTLSKDECFKRRCTRVYDPADVPGYFEQCVWPMYLLNLEDVKENCSDVIYLDGASNLKQITEFVLSDLQAFFQEKL